MLRKDFGAIFNPHSMSVSKYKRHICWCWWWSLLFWCCSSRPRWACVCRAWSPVFTIAIVCHCHCQQDKRQAGKGKIQSSKTIVLSWELTLDTCVFVNGGCHISSKRKSHHSLVSILKETYICIWVHHMGVPWLWFVDTHRSPSLNLYKMCHSDDRPARKGVAVTIPPTLPKFTPTRVQCTQTPHPQNYHISVQYFFGGGVVKYYLSHRETEEKKNE